MSTILLNDRPRSLKEWQSVELLASTALTKAGHAAVTGSAVYVGDWDKMMVVVDITVAAADATTDLLNVFIDGSMDNLAWYNMGMITEWEGDEGAHREQMIFIPGTRCVADPNAIIIASVDAGETVVRNHLAAKYIRYRVTVADNASDASFTTSIMASVYRNDIVRVQESEMKTIELYPLAAYTNETVPAASAIWEIGDAWDWMQVVLRTTNHDTDSGDKLDTMVDLSVDGVDWVNVGKFTQCDGDDGPWVELFTLVPGAADNVDASVVVTADAAETVIRPGFAGAFLRARAVITESGTDDESFTFALHAFIK